MVPRGNGEGALTSYLRGGRVEVQEEVEVEVEEEEKIGNADTGSQRIGLHQR